MLMKLREEYDKHNVNINIQKLEYLRIGEKGGENSYKG